MSIINLFVSFAMLSIILATLTFAVSDSSPSSPSQTSDLDHLNITSEGVLAIFDQWLFGDDNGQFVDIDAILFVLHSFLQEKIENLEEKDRKTFAGIGQLLRCAQQISLKQFAASKKLTENGIMEKLWAKIEIVQEQNQFWINTLAIWAERMPYLVDKLLGERILPCFDQLMEIINNLCLSTEWAKIGRKFNGWKGFCGELEKLTEKEEKMEEMGMDLNDQGRMPNDGTPMDIDEVAPADLFEFNPKNKGPVQPNLQVEIPAEGENHLDLEKLKLNSI